MSKRRMIDPAFWQSETMASLTIDQRFLFIGLFSNADDQGRLKGHPALIRNAIFPFDDPDLNKLQSDLDVIEATGSITQYKAGGKSFIQINGWWEYQSPQWAYPSEIPAPDGWQDRLKYRKDSKVIMDNWNSDGGFCDDSSGDDSPPETETKRYEAVTEPLPGVTTYNASLPVALPKDLGKATELELELELATEIEINRGESSGVAPAREAPKDASPSPGVIPAFKIWRESGMSMAIDKDLIAEIDLVVGRDPPDLELFGKICVAGRRKGWKKTSIDWPLDWFKRREIPGEDRHRKDNGNGRKSKRGAESAAGSAGGGGHRPKSFADRIRDGELSAV